MNERIKQQIRQGSLVTTLLLVSQFIFASGHMGDLGEILWIMALGILGTWGTGFLALIFAFKYRKNQGRNYQVAAWACVLVSVAVILYFAVSILSSDRGTSYPDAGDEYILSGLMIPLAVVVGSIFMLLTKPDELVADDALNYQGEAGNYPNTELNKLPGKWITPFKVFVFVVYPYKIITTLSFFAVLPGRGFSISFMHNSGTHTADMHTNILLTVQTVIGFLSLLYAPAIIYFMIKKSKWCWVLLCADSVFAGINMLLSGLTFSWNHLTETALIVEVALLFFVWLDEVAVYLNISKPEKTKYTIAISIVGVVLVAAKIMTRF